MCKRDQSHINIGSDGTLARAPELFLGPHSVLMLQNEVQFTRKVTQNLINFLNQQQFF